MSDLDEIRHLSELSGYDTDVAYKARGSRGKIHRRTRPGPGSTLNGSTVCGKWARDMTFVLLTWVTPEKACRKCWPHLPTEPDPTRRTPSRAVHPPDEFKHAAPGTAEAVHHVRTLPDVLLLEVARHAVESSDYPTAFGPRGERKPVDERTRFRVVLDEVDGFLSGGPTNPDWLTYTAAVEAYERDLIGEAELDRLVDR